jgi:predicted phage-related endonuclease
LKKETAMEMITHTCPQGSEEWHALRAIPKTKTASEAPMMMGCHPNVKRDELIHQKATLEPKEYSDYVERVVFTRGHETEDKARAIVEEIIGEDLYPITCTLGEYLSSYDGVNSLDANDTTFEHKQFNVGLFNAVKEKDLPPYIFWQIEHQFLVNQNMKRCIFACSDGTQENFAWMDYRPVAGRREQLIKAWAQLDKDVAEYVPTAKVEQVIGRKRTDSLPVLRVDVSGQLVTEDNIKQFKEQAALIISQIPVELDSDQDFANAEQDVKWLEDIEFKCVTIKDQLTSKANLDSIISAVEDIRENMARQTRLNLQRQIKAQKESRRIKLIDSAGSVFREAVTEANKEFSADGVVVVGFKVPDFSEVIKGKRSLDNMQSAINDEIAEVKISLTEKRDLIRANLALIKDVDEDYCSLFQDLQSLCQMGSEHLSLHILSEIRIYKEELDRLNSERIQKHKDVLSMIDITVSMVPEMEEAHLAVAKSNISAINPASMEEFSIEANDKKKDALKLIDDAIQVYQDARQEILDAKKALDDLKAKEQEKPTQTVNPAESIKPAIETPKPMQFATTAPVSEAADIPDSDNRVFVDQLVKEKGIVIRLCSDGPISEFIEIEDLSGKGIGVGTRTNDGRYTLITITASDIENL